MSRTSGPGRQLRRQHWSNASARRLPQISVRVAAGDDMALYEHTSTRRFQLVPRGERRPACCVEMSDRSAVGDQPLPEVGEGFLPLGFVVDLVPETLVPVHGLVRRAAL